MNSGNPGSDRVGLFITVVEDRSSMCSCCSYDRDTLAAMTIKKDSTKKAKIILRISDGLKRRAEKAADAKGRTLSGYIRRLIEKDAGK